MAQPAYAIEYLGAVQVLAGTQYTSASILTTYPTATVLKMDSKKIESGKYVDYPVRCSINGGIMFNIQDGDESYLTTGKTFIFDTNCTIIVGIYKAVV